MDLPKKTIGILLPGEEQRNKKRKESQGQEEGQAAEKNAQDPIADDAKIFEPTYEVIPARSR